MAGNEMKRGAGKTIQDKTSVLKYVANSRSLFLLHDKFMVDSAAIVMLYYPRFHDEEGLSKANVIKVT